MPRQARKISSTGLYHIYFRGVNHCFLFEERQDYDKFFKILKSVREDIPFQLYAYCLMSNHVHLMMLEEHPGDISLIMGKLLAPYAYWFNRKYLRSGALIANRYKSVCVEEDSYLLSLVRYIHQNPLRAGLATDIAEYRWSSYRDYIESRSTLTETGIILNYFSSERREAVQAFKAFHAEAGERVQVLKDKPKRSEEQVHREFLEILKGMEPNTICGLPKTERDGKLAMLRERGFTIKQIERETGVSRKIIERCR